jgi:hypothetical protein
MNTRIIERRFPDGKTVFVIQQRHWLFRVWEDAFFSSTTSLSRKAEYPTAESAKLDLCWFDGTPVEETEVLQK